MIENPPEGKNRKVETSASKKKGEEEAPEQNCLRLLRWRLVLGCCDGSRFVNFIQQACVSVLAALMVAALSSRRQFLYAVAQVYCRPQQLFQVQNLFQCRNAV